MANPYTNIIVQELNNNEVVKLQELYKIIDEFEDPSKDKTQKHHKIRSILYAFHKHGDIMWVAEETYTKIGEYVGDRPKE